MNSSLNEILRLTLVISRREAAPRSLMELAEQAFAGGVTAIQLREKGRPDREIYEEALPLRDFCRARKRALIINDRLDLALAVEADGLHLGQSDLPVGVAARLLPAGKILGLSVGTVGEARAALAEGAGYLGVGALFPTGSKDDALLIEPGEVRKIVALGASTVGIGGLTTANAARAWSFGLSGLAVISALAGAEDPAAAARSLLAGADT
jgi:Thiamine monophosphate synthase